MFRFVHELRRGPHSPGSFPAPGFKKLSMLAGGLIVALFSFTALWAATPSANGILAGETRVDATGALSYELPLKVAPGINGLTPELTLSYNSRNRKPGLLGVGWALNGLPAIYRCSKSLQLDGEVAPVEFNDSDRLCVDGVRLIASTGTSDADYWLGSARYYTYEESWVRYEPVGTYGEHGPNTFTAKTKSGNTLVFGKRGTLGIYGAGRWHLSQIKDRNDNAINISYLNTGGSQRPNEITYNTNHKVKFVYEATTTSDYDREVFYTTDGPNVLGGSADKKTAEHRLKSIDIYASGESSPFKSYELSYVSGGSLSTKRSLLEKIEECDRNANCLEPVDIEWNNSYNWYNGSSSGQFRKEVPTADDGGQDMYQYQLKGLHTNDDDGTHLYTGDFDGDGRSDFIKLESGGWAATAGISFCVYYANNTTKTDGKFSRVCPSASYLDNNNVSRNYQDWLKGSHGSSDDGVNLYVGDFNGDGAADFLRVEKGGWADGNDDNSFNVFLSNGTRDGLFSVVNPTGDSMQTYIKNVHQSVRKGVHLILGDYNGDGKTDFLAQQHGDWADTDGEDYGQDFTVYFSTLTESNTGSFTKYSPGQNGMSGSSIFRAYHDEDESGCSIIPGDFNGDGRTDFIRQEYGDFGGWTSNEVDNFEVYLSKGDGEFERVYSGDGTDYQKYLIGRIETFCAFCTGESEGVNIIPGDYNGDGRTDFVAQRWGAWANTQDGGAWRNFQVYLSKGDGDFEVLTPFNTQTGQQHFYGLVRNAPGNGGACSYSGGSYNCNSSSTALEGSFLFAADLNGDGRTDLMRQEGSQIASNNSTDTFQIYLSKGNGYFDSAITPTGNDYQANLKASHNNFGQGTSLIPGDYDGDGLTDFLKQEHGDWVDGNEDHTFDVFFNPANSTDHSQPQDTVKIITQAKLKHEISYGLMTELDPAREQGFLNAYPTSSFKETLNTPIWLVKQIKENPTDTLLADRTADYDYGAPVSGDKGGFMGFRLITITHPEKDLQVKTTYEFHGLDEFRAARPKWVQTYKDSTNTEIRFLNNEWSIGRGYLQGAGNSTFVMKLNDTYDYDRSHHSSASLHTDYVYDAYMNVTRKYEEYDGTGRLYTCTSYNTDTTNWVLDQVSSRKVDDAFNCLLPFKRTDYGYDGNGNLISEKRYHKTNGYLETGYSNFTTAGLPQTVTRASGLVRTLAYDTHGHISSITEGSHTFAFSYDAKWGDWLTKTDPNGNVFSKQYDKFGRLLTESAPNNSGSSYQRKSVEYSWNSNNLVQENRIRTNWTGNDRTEKTHRNAYGQIVRKEDQASGQTTIITLYDYNPRDQKIKESLPVFSGGTRRDTEYKYEDNYFRLTRVIPPVGFAADLDYNTGGVCASSEQRVTQTRDNRTTVSCKHIGGQVTRTEYQATEGTKVLTRSYDRFRRLEQLADGLTTTTYVYDMLDRKKSEENDQKGKTWYYYYESGAYAGLLDRREHFGTNGTTLVGKDKYDTYDSLKRPTKITYTDVASATRVVEYTYDQTGSCSTFSNAKGRLCQSTVKNTSGTVVLTRVRGYDNTGKLKTLATTLNQPNKKYTMAYEYGPMGNRTKVTYPQGREANYTYDTMGRLDKVQEAVTGTTVYADYNDYNAAGRAGEVLVNNSGVTETRTYDDYHRLTNIKVDKGLFTTHMDQALTYTGFGEIDTIDGDLVGNAIFFDYDYNKWGYITRAESAGYQNYGTMTFGYDSSARLQWKDAKAYTYHSTRKYRVSSRTGSDNLSLSYNAGGAVSFRVKSGTTSAYTYDHNQQLLKVIQGGSTVAEFGYDENGKRWLKTDTVQGRDHYYISPEMDVQNNNGTWIPAHYINGPEGRISVQSGSGTGVDLVLQQYTQHKMLADLQSLESVQGFVNWGYHTAAMYVLHPAMPAAANALLVLLLLIGVISFTWIFLRSAREQSALGRMRMRFADLLFDAGLLNATRADAFAEAAGTSFMRRNRKLALGIPLVMLGLFTFQCAQNESELDGALAGQGIPGLLGAGNFANGLPNANQGRYFHTNKVGNVNLVTDKNGNAIATPIYKPFGELHHVGAHNDTRYKFQSKELDHTTGLYYFGARYYDADLGRFMQPDTLSIGANVPHASNQDRYAFAGNNPINFADPSGNVALLSAFAISLIIAAAKATAIAVAINFAIGIAMAGIAALATGQRINWRNLMIEVAIGTAISLGTAGVGYGFQLAGRTAGFIKAAAGISYSRHLASPALRNVAKFGASVGKFAAAHPGAVGVAAFTLRAGMDIAEGTLTTAAMMKGVGDDPNWRQAAKGAAQGVGLGRVVGTMIDQKITKPMDELLEKNAKRGLPASIRNANAVRYERFKKAGEYTKELYGMFYGEFVGYGKHHRARGSNARFGSQDHRMSRGYSSGAGDSAGYSIYSGFSGLTGDAEMPSYGL